MGPLLLGTIIWLVLAIVFGWWVLARVEKNSSELRKEANLKYIIYELELQRYQL